MMVSNTVSPIRSPWQESGLAIVWQRMLVGSVASFGMSLLFFAIWLVIRRSNGAISAPLTLLPGVLAALLLAGFLLALKHTSSYINQVPRLLLFVVLGLVSLAATVCLVALQAFTLLGWLLSLVAICGAEWTGWRSLLRTAPATSPSLSQPTAPPTTESTSIDLESRDELEEKLNWTDGSEDRMLQKMTRCITPEGSQVVVMEMELQFDAGESVQVAHIPFCPSFDVTPEAEVVQLAGNEAEMVSLDVQTYGLRTEWKLASPATEIEHIHIEVAVYSEGES